MLSSDEKSVHAAIAYILTFQHVHIVSLVLRTFLFLSSTQLS